MIERFTQKQNVQGSAVDSKPWELSNPFSDEGNRGKKGAEGRGRLCPITTGSSRKQPRNIVSDGEFLGRL
jgi:hypothetical protein